MIAVTPQFRENRLAKLVLRRDGLTKAAASAAAEENLAAIHDECLAEVDRNLDMLKRSAADPRTGEAVTIQREIYAHANTIAGIAGCCGLAEMGEAAFSLCELVDRLIASGAWSGSAVTVHMDAMTLLRAQDGALAPAARRAMIEGLRSVAWRAPAPTSAAPRAARGD